MMFKFPVVFVDIETTGGSYKNSRVLEVAAIRVENGAVVREFSTIVNPQTYIPSFITSMTGITDSDAFTAPTFAEIADELAKILDGAIFIAHNVRFDYSFLKQEFALLNQHFLPKMLCTVRLSRALYKQQQGHSLAKLIERHAIPATNRHRALDDARAIHYFSQLAHREHGDELFEAAIAHQLKTQYLPANLNMTELQSVGNHPGVYIFEDEEHQPLYVGKSITLKKRILSHFQDVSSRELKMSQKIHHVRTIPTGNELAALILESQLIKKLQPIFNRQLRRATTYALLIKAEINNYATIQIQSGNIHPSTNFQTIYGLYETRTKAKKRLDEITRTFNLCPKLMGLEKSKQACFWHNLRRCEGACVGKENPKTYNQRFETALEHNRLAAWPFSSAVAIPVDTKDNGVIIDNWIIKGFYSANNPNSLEPFETIFDVDEYKIIRRFIKENTHALKLMPN